MLTPVEELLRQASALDEHKRATLAGMLLESLEHEIDEDVESAWKDEIERRLAELDGDHEFTSFNFVDLRINTLESIVTLNDAEAVVIGGVTTSNLHNLRNRNPFLSRIPIIGKLFRAEIHEIERRELVVVIKPTILRNHEDYPGLSPAQTEMRDEGKLPIESPNIRPRPKVDIP